MNFVSTDQFYQDVVAWERQLPHFDAVCGIPRSGLFPASYIAMRRNIRMIDLAVLRAQPDKAFSYANIRDNNPILNEPHGNKVLIVDDSVSNESVTIRKNKWILATKSHDLDISYGAVYRASDKSQVDYYYREVPMPRIFGWNWFRHFYLRSSILDMDGVICQDWKYQEQDDDPVYRKHLMEAEPLYIPKFPLLGIATSRLERYRDLTEAWLAKHNIQYGELIMHPARSPEERRTLNDHAKCKDRFYRRSQAMLFIESDVRQAKLIHEMSRKPVLCIDNMTMYNYDKWNG